MCAELVTPNLFLSLIITYYYDAMPSIKLFLKNYVELSAMYMYVLYSLDL